MCFLGMTFKIYIRLAVSLAIVSALIFGARAAQAHELTRAEITICAKLKTCLNILERHGPDKFDYRVLQEAVLKFGPAGKAALFTRLTSNDKTAQSRAQILLSKNALTYGPEYQAQIAAVWPRGDIAAHAKIMRANLSTAVISRAIETLSHPNPEIAQLSRDIMDSAATSQNRQPLGQMDYGRLAKAAINAPTPAMVNLLKSTAPETSHPVLTRILRSGDGPSIIAAYDALYAQDPKTAFQTLVGTLYDLKDNEAQSAFALAALLRHRHENRADGFYLKFASDVANDSKMSLMGRIVGFDAVMGYKGVNGPALAQTPLMISNLKTALDNYKTLPHAYAKNFYTSAKENSKPWTDLMWGKLKADPYKYPETAKAFFNNIAKLPTPLTSQIVSQALSNKSDYGMLVLGIKSAAAQKDKSRTTQLTSFKTHPIAEVRAASALAVTALTTGTEFSKANLLKDTKQMNISAKMCRAIPHDFKDDAKQLPFFELTNVNITATGPRRHYVQTAAPTRSGWLVGFGAGEAGGDLQFYDNKSGKGISILKPENGIHNNVIAILPVRPQALGQYASEFWAVISDGNPNGGAAIYRLSERPTGFNLVRHSQLPNAKTQIAQQKNGDVFISFYDETDKNYIPHAPLLLSPNGELRRACENPSNENLKALP